MKRARPWLYFLIFIAALAAISIFKENFPEMYERGAVVVIAVWILGGTVLSVITIHRHATHADSGDPGGFGMAALPLPRSWKRWIYDEREP